MRTCNHNISREEVYRWYCLFECIHVVNEFAKNNGYDTEYILTSKLKPNQITAYIENRLPYLERQLNEHSEYMKIKGDSFLFKMINR